MSEKREKLEKLGEKKRTKSVARFLKSKDPEVRADALRALGTCGTEDAVNLLTNWSQSKVKEERIAAYEGIAKCGKDYSITMMRHDLETETDPDVIAAIKDATHAIRSRLTASDRA